MHPRHLGHRRRGKRFNDTNKKIKKKKYSRVGLVKIYLPCKQLKKKKKLLNKSSEKRRDQSAPDSLTRTTGTSRLRHA